MCLAQALVIAYAFEAAQRAARSAETPQAREALTR